MDDHSSEAGDKTADPEFWVDDYGDFLFGYAMRRLQDRQIAEDLVQETFMAALSSRDRFQRHSSQRTWLVGILKHKIIDHFRKAHRDRMVNDAIPLEEVGERYFDPEGKWAVKPARWNKNPLEDLEDKEFWVTLQACMVELPKSLTDAFVLREFESLAYEEIARVLNVTANHLGVMLYRARTFLRRCLEVRGIQNENDVDM